MDSIRPVPDVAALPACRSEFRVRYAETDRMGVVYHAEYLVWCEIGRTEFIRSRWRSYADLERDGVLLAVASASLRYHAGARYDDLVCVTTSLAKIGSRGLAFDYVITRSATGERLVTASTSLVAVDASGRGRRLPDELRAALTSPASA